LKPPCQSNSMLLLLFRNFHRFRVQLLGFITPVVFSSQLARDFIYSRRRAFRSHSSNFA
jgi:hypothetical protein